MPKQAASSPCPAGRPWKPTGPASVHSSQDDDFTCSDEAAATLKVVTNQMEYIGKSMTCQSLGCKQHEDLEFYQPLWVDHVDPIFFSAAQIDRIFIWGPPFPVHTVSPRRQGDGPKWGPNGPTKVPYPQCGQPNNKRPKSGIVLSFRLIKRILVGGWATHPTTLVVPIILTKEIQKKPWWLQPPIIQCANVRKSPSRFCRYALAVPWKSLDLRYFKIFKVTILPEPQSWEPSSHLDASYQVFLQKYTCPLALPGAPSARYR